MKFVVYEIWTRARVVEASSCEEAYEKGEPDPALASTGLELANWHAVPADGLPDEPPITGGLNYRQVPPED